MSVSDENIKHIVNRIVKELARDKLNFEFLKAAEIEASKREAGLSDLKDHILEGFKQTGYEQKLANFVVQKLPLIEQSHHCFTPEEHKKEPLNYIRKSQVNYRSKNIIF